MASYTLYKKNKQEKKLSNVKNDMSKSNNPPPTIINYHNNI